MAHCRLCGKKISRREIYCALCLGKSRGKKMLAFVTMITLCAVVLIACFHTTKEESWQLRLALAGKQLKIFVQNTFNFVDNLRCGVKGLEGYQNRVRAINQMCH